MRIFFGLRDAQIAKIHLSHDIGENVVHRFRRNDHGQTEFFVVLGHANVGEIFRDAVARDGGVEIFGAGKIAPSFGVETTVAGESASDLADAVGAKVEADAGIVVANGSERLAAYYRCRRKAR